MPLDALHGYLPLSSSSSVTRARERNKGNEERKRKAEYDEWKEQQDAKTSV